MMFIGNIIAFTGHDIPDGYLECNGSAVSREEFSELFAVIGTTYGAGDGSTTFNLPNLSGNVALGVSQTHSIGSNGGEESHVLIASETPIHTHEIPEHTHGNSITAKTPSLSHTITHQPVVKYTKLGSNASTKAGMGSSAYTSTNSGTMTISKNLAIANHPATACTVTGGIIDCPEFETENAGEGIGHNNMMPYLAVTYIIKAGTPVPPEPGMALFNGCCVVSAGGGYITGKTI